MIKKTLLSLSMLASFGTACMAQNPFAEYSNMFTPPLSYVVQHTTTPPHIDGNINDLAWANTEWTDYFQDIEGDLKPKPHFKTRVKMLWDDNYLYFAVEMEEPHVWAKLEKRDEIVFFDNDFEIFLDPSNSTHKYFEVEINALNNIFDLFIHKPYNYGGSALFSWNAEGMKHAVNIQGSLNNPNDKDKGWTVEIAIPFSAVTLGNNKHLPKENEIWRLNFSRVEWHTDIINGEYVKRKDNNGKGLPEMNWVWSPQGVINMHHPERWGYLQFSKNSTKTFALPYSEKQRQYLWLLHYKQRDFRNKNKRFAQSLKELGMDKISINIDGKKNTLILSATPTQYEAWIKDGKAKSIRINHEGLCN